MDLPLPANTPEHMASAYYGCLHWAVSFELIRKQFEEETGVKPPISRPRSGIEAMVDKACGIDHEKDMLDYLLTFKDWHDKNVWGDEENLSLPLTELPTEPMKAK